MFNMESGWSTLFLGAFTVVLVRCVAEVYDVTTVHKFDVLFPDNHDQGILKYVPPCDLKLDGCSEWNVTGWTHSSYSGFSLSEYSGVMSAETEASGSVVCLSLTYRLQPNSGAVIKVLMENEYNEVIVVGIETAPFGDIQAVPKIHVISDGTQQGPSTFHFHRGRYNPKRHVQLGTMSSPDAAQHSANDLSVPQEPRRRVSISADPPTISDGRHSPYFGQETRRRLSVASSDHQSEGRRKSILVQHTPDNLSLHSLHSGNPNYVNYGFQHDEGGKPANGDGPHKKLSVTESFYEKLKSQQPENVEQSWWFMFCKRCRQEESGPSWEPPLWQRVCPYPFCPTYRQFARILSLVLIGLLCWGIVYALLGETATPGGSLFGLAIICIAAHFGGWLMSLTTLPPLIGMLLTGLLLQNVGLVHIAEEFREVVSVLRKVALVIILTRAGLDLDSAALKRMRITVPKLGLIPWIVECTVIAIMTRYLLDLPWIWAFLLGSVIAAVSPAVVVSCLFRLRQKGYGVAKGIPTLIIAVSGIDDAMSVALFGIIHSIIFSSDALVFQIIQGPISIIGGMGFGIIWGLLAKYVPEKQDPFVVPLRVLMLFGGGLIAVLGSETIGYGGAGPLACITAAFVSCFFWTKEGWEVEDNPVATAFEIFWMIFEPILFGLTGTQIKFDELDRDTVGIGMACLITAIVIRIISTVLVGVRSKLNLKEKIFVALSWMAKATVQAALAPVAMDSVKEGNRPEEERVYAEHVLVVCVLSILLTAPVGAILITLSGPRLLKKTTTPAIVEGWRRSHRPSLRDISITEEDDGVKDVAT